MMYSIKIANGEEDGDRNSFSGDSLNRENILIGDYSFIKTWGVVRFPLNIGKGADILSASLSLYLSSIEGELKDSYNIQIDYSIEDNALSLNHGLNRKYSYENIKIKHKLTLNDWNNLKITGLVSDIVNREKWQKGNHIAIRIRIPDTKNELFRFGSADGDPSSAAILNVEHDIPDIEILEFSLITESILIGKGEFINKDIIKLGDLELHPENATFLNKAELQAFGIQKESPAEIDLDERIDFLTANKILNMVGGIFPFACQGQKFNCILQSCNLDFAINYVNVSISLIVI